MIGMAGANEAICLKNIPQVPTEPGSMTSAEPAPPVSMEGRHPPAPDGTRMARFICGRVVYRHWVVAVSAALPGTGSDQRVHRLVGELRARAVAADHEHQD
jgi:hypothetical protein